MDILIWSVTGLFLLAGLAGAVLPALPGLPLIFAGALVHGLLTGWAKLGWTTVLVLGLITAVMQVLDYLATAWGVKRLGGTKWGIIGSVLGSILGLVLLSLPGLILGAFAGAVLGETLGGGQDLKAALRIGGGSLLGLLAGTLARTAAALAMAAIFLMAAI